MILSDITNLAPGMIFGELSKDDSKGDVFLDAWLPNSHKDWADYGENLVLGEAFSDYNWSGCSYLC
jgi:glycine betaine/proline transport system substrate-binding protein